MGERTNRRTMLTRTMAGALPLWTFCLSNAQTADNALTFEAASIKPAVLPKSGGAMMAPPAGGPGTQDPSRVHYPFITLKALISNAYDLKAYQIEGPTWLDAERFDLNATMPRGTTNEQFRVMLRNLLVERFKLAVSKGKKQRSIYSLVVAKNGPKLKESDSSSPAKYEDLSPSAAPLAAPKIGRDGFPVLPSSVSNGAGLFLMMMPGRARLIGQQQTTLDLANRLAALLGQPVGDATGLKAKYDFTLTFSPEGMTAPMGTPTGPGLASPVSPLTVPEATAGATSPNLPEGDDLPDVFRAVKEQLGLALEPRQGAVDVIVIDHVERTPTEN